MEPACPDRSTGRAGHRTRPHTADLQVEAWGPTRAECLRQAVLGSVESFLDTSGVRPVGAHEVAVDGDDHQILVGVLEEVVYLADTTGNIPVEAVVRCSGRHCDVRFGTVAAGSLPQIGAVPKAVSWHRLRFDRDSGGWSCLVTWDV